LTEMIFRSPIQSFQEERYPIGQVVKVTCPKHFRLPSGMGEVKCEKKGWNVKVDELKCISKFYNEQSNENPSSVISYASGDLF
jgi:hypothetical protein